MRCCKNIDRGGKLRDGSPMIDFCQKKAKHFYRVDYPSDHPNRPSANWQTARKIYGFCPSCNTGMEDASNWFSGRYRGRLGSVCKLWVEPSQVHIISEAEANTAKEDKTVEQIKDKFKAVMKYKWTSKISRETWIMAFQEALDELVIENVMEL